MLELAVASILGAAAAVSTVSAENWLTTTIESSEAACCLKSKMILPRFVPLGVKFLLNWKKKMISQKVQVFIKSNLFNCPN